jgi:hypothetical protein
MQTNTQVLQKMPLGRKIVFLLCVLTIIVAAVLIVDFSGTAILGLSDAVSFLRFSTMTSGTVTQYVCSQDTINELCTVEEAALWPGPVFPVVSFSDTIGYTHAVLFFNTVLAPSPRASDYPMGSRMDVFYDKDDPAKAFIADHMLWDLWLMPLLFIAISLILFTLLVMAFRSLLQSFAREIGPHKANLNKG